MRLNRTALVALAGGAVLLGAGGTALAAQGADDRAARCQERLSTIAERRGLSVEQLEANVKARLTARADAALAAGRISPERAARLKQRIAQGELCKAPRAVKPKLARHGLLRAAAVHLGLTRSELRAQLPGTSLAALAAKQGKSVDGLESAMLAPSKAKLSMAVERGRIAQERADRILNRLEALVERLVLKTFPAR